MPNVRAAPRTVQRPARASTGLVASGSVEVEEVSVAAEVGGFIVEMAADEGDEIEAGARDQEISLLQANVA